METKRVFGEVDDAVSIGVSGGSADGQISNAIGSPQQGAPGVEGQERRTAAGKTAGYGGGNPVGRLGMVWVAERVAQQKGGTIAIGRFRPGTAIGITEVANRICAVQEREPLAAVGKISGVFARDSRIERVAVAQSESRAILDDEHAGSRIEETD